MARVWTHGTWTVRPGYEEDFVVAWAELRDAIRQEFERVEPPTLLRDRERDNVFVSFGPWPDLEHALRFRNSPTFTQAFAAIGELLEDFKAMTLDEVEA